MSSEKEVSKVENTDTIDNQAEAAGAGYRVWVMIISALFGAACASFLCALLAGSFGIAFYGSIAIGAALGFLGAAVIYVVTGKIRTSEAADDVRIVVMLATAGIFFAAGTMVFISSKDVKAPEIAFSDEIITMREGDPEEVLFANMTVSDNVDGDLIDQLKVTSFRYAEGGKTADVTYSVSDSSGNKTIAAQLVYVEGEPWPAE